MATYYLIAKPVTDTMAWTLSGSVVSGDYFLTIEVATGTISWQEFGSFSSPTYYTLTCESTTDVVSWLG